MLKLELESNIVNVPSSWGEVALGDYEPWYINPPKDGADYIRYFADLCKVDAELLMNASPEVFRQIRETMAFACDTSFVPQQKVRIGKVDYFISLSDQLTLGEWVDIDAILGDEESLTKLSDLLAVVCRPLEENYNHKAAVERAELFRQQSCKEMLPLVSFFLHREKSLKETLSHFSVAVEAASQLLQDTKTFAASGDGIKRLPIWQRIRYYFLIRSLQKQLSRFSDFSFIV